MLTVFLRDIHEGNLSLKDADIKQNHLINELRNMQKSKIAVEEISFLKNSLFISTREKILNNFKGKIFLTKNFNQHLKT